MGFFWNPHCVKHHCGLYVPASNLCITHDILLLSKLENRNSRVSGFRDQDVLTLQKLLDEEFEREKENLIRQQREKKEQAAKQAGLQRKHMLLERQLREEMSEIGEDHRIEFSLSLVKQNATPFAVRIQVNSITARALAKALWMNISLTSLDLSCNDIDDLAGAYIGRAMKRNSALVNLDLGSNQLGMSACRAFGESLRVNTTLKSLSLESNPLTRYGEDLMGIRAIADMLRINHTLTYLNMWRCALGVEAGAVLSRGIKSNRAVTFIELGHNGITMIDQNNVQAVLEQNIKRYEELKTAQHEEDIDNRLLAEEKALEEQMQAERLLWEWLEEQKQIRAEERRVCEEKRFAEQVEIQKERAHLLQQKIEADKAEAARLSRKKKGKK